MKGECLMRNIRELVANKISATNARMTGECQKEPFLN